MQFLMNYTFEGGLENFEDIVEEYEQAVSRFEMRFQVIVDDTVQQAVLKTNVPEEIRDKVELENFDSFNELKDTVNGWVQQKLGKVKKKDDQKKKKKKKKKKDDDMDVDAVWKGKGKGKGQE